MFRACTHRIALLGLARRNGANVVANARCTNLTIIRLPPKCLCHQINQALRRRTLITSVGSMCNDLAGLPHTGPERKELAAFEQHLLCERQKDIEQLVQVIVCHVPGVACHLPL